MVTTQIKIAAVSVTGILILCSGMWIGYRMARGKMIPTKPEPQVIQADHSTVLATVPVAVIQPTTQIPRGAKVLQSGTLVLSKSSGGTGPTNGTGPKEGATPGASLPAIPKIDFSVVQEPDGADRIIAKADGYDVTGTDMVLAEHPGPTLKRELLGLAGWDSYQHKAVYGAEALYHPWQHVTVGAGFIGQTGFVSSGVQF